MKQQLGFLVIGLLASFSAWAEMPIAVTPTPTNVPNPYLPPPTGPAVAEIPPERVGTLDVWVTQFPNGFNYVVFRSKDWQRLNPQCEVKVNGVSYGFETYGCRCPYAAKTAGACSFKVIKGESVELIARADTAMNVKFKEWSDASTRQPVFASPVYNFLFNLDSVRLSADFVQDVPVAITAPTPMPVMPIAVAPVMPTPFPAPVPPAYIPPPTIYVPIAAPPVLPPTAIVTSPLDPCAPRTVDQKWTWLRNDLSLQAMGDGTFRDLTSSALGDLEPGETVYRATSFGMPGDYTATLCRMQALSQVGVRRLVTVRGTSLATNDLEDRAAVQAGLPVVRVTRPVNANEAAFFQAGFPAGTVYLLIVKD